ncbi:hypothetical protein CAPTEDRAFT_226295 [Capitella teleta]|uniref:MARVEL domain-containing protein n=1 Tax=Capitella teleta TaxID=283909 RepID=R7U075_CAPTE|nr:hypothetical protein CAPTEDRAFT_226295 [Capitella teleta]|eukprot:ELT96605.1 hypothetical protein CAPTEDRAFT_226295 [Capitella teleta]
MSEFSANSIWNKLAFLFVHLSFATMLFAFMYGAWAKDPICVGCEEDLVRFMMVVGYVCLLMAVVLAECLSLLDEVRGNKGALISFIVFAFIAGCCILIADAYYISKIDTATYSNTDTIMSALMALLAGIFALLEVCGVNSK